MTGRYAAMDYGILNRYIQPDWNTTPLSAEEEIDLIRKYRKGDMDARRRLIESNFRFVIKLAMNYRKRGLNLADLIQEGCLGLIDALGKFDPKKNCRLITYASWWIRLYMQRSVEQKVRQVNLPINKMELLRKMNAVQNDFVSEHGRNPYPDEIAIRLNIDIKKIEELTDRTLFFQTLHSRDDDHPGMEGILIDEESPDARDEVWMDEANECLAAIMQHLTPREREVIEHRYDLSGHGKKLSLRKVGLILGLSAEGVRRIEEQALKKLRRPILREKVAALFAA